MELALKDPAAKSYEDPFVPPLAQPPARALTRKLGMMRLWILS